MQPNAQSNPLSDLRFAHQATSGASQAQPFDSDMEQRIAKARAAGYSDEQIIPLATAYQAKKDAATKESSKGLSDWYPTIGSVGGGVIGGVLAGPPGAIALSALGGSVGEGARQSAQGEDMSLPKIALQGALGGVSEGGGMLVAKGIGAGAKLLTKSGESVLGKVGDDVFHTVVRPNMYTKEGISDLVKTATDNGLMKGTVSQGLDALPGKMEDVTARITNKLKAIKTPADLEFAKQNFKTQLDATSGLVPGAPDGQYGAALERGNSLIDKLGGQKSFIVDASGNPFKTSNPASLLDLYKLKAAAGESISKALIKEAKGGSLNYSEAADKALWGSLKDTIEFYAPGTKALNSTQHDLMSIGEAFAKRYYQEAKAHPGVGFKDLTAIFAGNAFGGPMVGGALAVGDLALRTGLGRSVIGNTLKGAGKVAGMAGSGPGLLAGGALGATATSLSPFGKSNENQQEDNKYNGSQDVQQNNLPPVTSINPSGDSVSQLSATVNNFNSPNNTMPAMSSSQPPTITGHTLDQISRAINAATADGNKIAVEHLSDTYDREFKYQQQQKQNQQQDRIGVAAAQELGAFSNAYHLAEKVNKGLDKYKDLMGPVAGRLNIMNPYNTDAQVFNSDMKLLTQNVVRAFQGSRMSDQDIAIAQSYVPVITDTPAVARGKIKNLMSMIEDNFNTTQQQYIKSGYNPGK